MTREELKEIVFKTHSPLTVEEVMFGIDKYVEQINAEVIKPFEDLYNHHICIDYDFPEMRMLMDFYNCFKEVLRKVKEQK